MAKTEMRYFRGKPGWGIVNQTTHQLLGTFNTNGLFKTDDPEILLQIDREQKGERPIPGLREIEKKEFEKVIEDQQNGPEIVDDRVPNPAKDKKIDADEPDDDGNFKPLSKLNRAQLGVVLAEAIETSDLNEADVLESFGVEKLDDLKKADIVKVLS